jgi:hypothetical protein
MIKTKTRLLICLLLLLYAGLATATGSIRCSGRIVDQGMEKDEVIKLCGEPTVRDEGDSYWFYDRGDLNLVTRIFFVGDKAEFIDDVLREKMP